MRVSDEIFEASFAYLLVDLCLIILKLKTDDPRQCSETLKSITHALRGLCSYMKASPQLCNVSLYKQNDCRVSRFIKYN